MNAPHTEPLKNYFIVFVCLIVLTLATVTMAYVDLGVLNIVITLAIAGIKTTLILLFFMHVRHSMNLVKIFLVTGFLWVILLVGILMSDYLTRRWDFKENTPTWITEKASHYLVPKGEYKNQ
ncbi:MAG: hypothetical protein AUJ72_04400 [Candidatus Omnitrophica bacterium CG1_02_46_14]|nr:MAG: hypothetical protein AUJ72_04400 [Candidatus Omnitrophica bacterium CG1_02_46_14]